jgi:hypothetical protein
MIWSEGYLVVMTPTNTPPSSTPSQTQPNPTIMFELFHSCFEILRGGLHRCLMSSYKNLAEVCINV